MVQSRAFPMEYHQMWAVCRPLSCEPWTCWPKILTSWLFFAFRCHVLPASIPMVQHGIIQFSIIIRSSLKSISTL